MTLIRLTLCLFLAAIWSRATVVESASRHKRFLPFSNCEFPICSVLFSQAFALRTGVQVRRTLSRIRGEEEPPIFGQTAQILSQLDKAQEDIEKQLLDLDKQIHEAKYTF